MADVLHFLLWYLVISVIGIVSFPIAYRFFPHLASKGVAFAKPLGLLIWGYLYWILCSLGVLQNDLGGEVLAFALLFLLASLTLLKGQVEEIKAWIRGNWKTIVTIEGVFLVFFALWAVVRAANPDITGTEKPMELAFINSILRSPAFPPQDPWLSGYAISYYYFGYVLIAMLIRVTGVVSGVGYNLTSALWFGLTAVTAFGIVFDLTAFWKRGQEAQTGSIFTQAQKAFARWAGILGSFFILIVSNLEGMLEVLHSGGVFWQKAADGTLTSKFWSWLAILDLSDAPTTPFNWIPSRYYIWWRGSRVLRDLNYTNGGIEIIDEFPFFSYLLSDLHPHVLAMPFAIMAMGVALNLFICGSENLSQDWAPWHWFSRWEFWLTGLVLGSMAFFNTWDFPIYVGLFCLVLVYLKIKQIGWSGKRILDFLYSGLLFGIVGIILFLPFFLSFKSQAGGLLPSLEFMTRGIHFWIMFAPLLMPIFIWLFYQWRKTKVNQKFSKGALFSLYLIGGLWVMSSFLGLLFFSAEPLGNELSTSLNPAIISLGQKLVYVGQLFAGVHSTSDGATVLALSLTRRLAAPGTWLTLAVLLVLVWGLLASDVRKDLKTPEGDQPDVTIDSWPVNANVFVLFLILIGAGLTLFPEFFYLRDQFGSRMNTIFKFYFQTWMFWGVAAAFATATLWHELKGWRNWLFTFVWSVFILAALAYPTIMILNKTNSFQPSEWTLNGNAYVQKYTPDEALAMDWLKTAPMGVVVEAVGGSYSEYARVSEQTGLPSVLGWPGHELQWRGGSGEMGSRQDDIKIIYQSTNWDEVFTLIQKYNIRYIYIGSLERNTYQLSMSKFDANLTPAYQNGTVTIYEIPESMRSSKP